MRNNAKRGWYAFSLIVAIVVLPMLIAYFLYTYHSYFTFNTTNHGLLVKPPMQVNFIGTARKWRILYIYKKPCDKTCQQTSYLLHQVRKVLGKDIDRTELIILSDQDAISIALQKQFSTLLFVANKIYLIDPMGNLFMYYLDQGNPMDIVKDLKKVLGASQIG